MKLSSKGFPFKPSEPKGTSSGTLREPAGVEPSASKDSKVGPTPQGTGASAFSVDVTVPSDTPLLPPSDTSIDPYPYYIPGIATTPEDDDGSGPIVEIADDQPEDNDSFDGTQLTN